MIKTFRENLLLLHCEIREICFESFGNDSELIVAREARSERGKGHEDDKVRNEGSRVHKFVIKLYFSALFSSVNDPKDRGRMAKGKVFSRSSISSPKRQEKLPKENAEKSFNP